MEFSGAAKRIDDTLERLKPEMIYVENVLFPAIKKLEKIENNWVKMQKNLSDKQKMKINQNGYAFLNYDQLKLIYKDAGI